jgi:hypothetical protein
MPTLRGPKMTFAGLIACSLLAGAAAHSPRGAAAAAAEESARRIPAPELDGADAWVNAPHPLRLSELKGKVVLLDFWTYG